MNTRRPTAASSAAPAFRPTTPALALIATLLTLLAGCYNDSQETITIQRGNTIVTLPANRTLRPINLAEGQQIATDLAEGKLDPAKLTTEDRRQLAALLAATKKKSRD